MKKLLLALFMLVLTGTAFSQTNAKQEKIKKLMEVTGSGSLGIQMMKSMIASYQKNHPGVPEDFWNQFMGEVKAEDLVSMIIPIYEKHFTEPEIDELITFYNTPAGKKMIEKMPVIMQESMSAGRVWGKEIAEKIMIRLKEKGFVKGQTN